MRKGELSDRVRERGVWCIPYNEELKEQGGNQFAGVEGVFLVGGLRRFLNIRRR